MPSNAPKTLVPIRCKYIATKLWEDVDDSTGQDIAFTDDTKEQMFTVVTADSTTLVTGFWITAPSTESDKDAAWCVQNPFPMSLVRNAGKTLCNIKAASGETVDIYGLSAR